MRTMLPLSLSALALVVALPASAQNLGDIVGQLLGVQGDSSLRRCESVGGRTTTCNIPTGYRVEFVRQLSTSPCTPGSTMVINPQQVIVGGGCRAEFRMIELAGGGVYAGAFEAALAEELRGRLIKPANEYGSLYDVRIVNGQVATTSNGRERIHTGLAQANWGGRVYPLDYSARVDLASGRFLNVDYRYHAPNATATSGSAGSGAVPTNWVTGTALNSTARAALERAIAAEHRRQSAGARSVQVVLNTAYRQQMVARSNYVFTGKYGVSVNDGAWQTFEYEGRVNLANNAVSQLQTGLTP